jgi:hypothetical protein
MAKSTKINAAASDAYERYVAVTAELLAVQLEEQANGATELSERGSKLRRRAGAYHAQWLAAERRAEQAQDREDAR